MSLGCVCSCGACMTGAHCDRCGYSVTGNKPGAFERLDRETAEAQEGYDESVEGHARQLRFAVNEARREEVEVPRVLIIDEERDPATVEYLHEAAARHARMRAREALMVLVGGAGAAMGGLGGIASLLPARERQRPQRPEDEARAIAAAQAKRERRAARVRELTTPRHMNRRYGMTYQVDMSVALGHAKRPPFWQWTTYLAAAVQVPPDFDARTFYRGMLDAAKAEAKRRGLNL